MVSGMDRGWLWEVEGLVRLRKGSGWWRQHVWWSPIPLTPPHNEPQRLDFVSPGRRNRALRPEALGCIWAIPPVTLFFPGT